MPAPSVTRTVLRVDVEDDVPNPPVPPPGWARSYAMLSITGTHGIAVPIDGQTSIRHLLLCVFSEQRRNWRRQDIEALEIVGLVVAEEIRVRAELTAQERIADGLRRFSLRDALTNLPNRELLLDRLGHATARWARMPERSFAVLSVGIEQLRDIEATLGYDAADDVLAAVAQRLGGMVRGVDTVARTGGDEFVILLESMTNQEDAVTVARRVRDIFHSPVTTRWSDSVIVSANVGIVLITSGIDSAPRLLQLAAVARTRAQTRGTGVEFFDPGMQERAQKRLKYQTELRQAVEAGEFELRYQPIICLETGRIAQLEALLRWRRPGGGLVPASEFLPLAEETGVIVPIGWWVFAESCLQLAEWRRELDSASRIAVCVNVAARQLAQPDFVDRVESVLSASGLEAGGLHLEVTEASLIDESANAQPTLDRLRGLGVRVALDDYGTGYSSLRLLHDMPLDTVKIDRSVVARLPEDERHVSMMATITALARQIGVSVVAEGIESAAQLDAVRAVGCDRAQGYLISQPLAAADAGALLSRRE